MSDTAELQIHHRTMLDDETRHVARVYAEALYNAMPSEEHLQEVLNELETLTQGVFRQDPGLELFFSSAAISRERKAEVIHSAFDHKASPEFVRFLLVLNNHDRLGALRAIADAFHELYDRKHRKIVAQVRSAVPLTDQERHRLIDDLRSVTGMEPILHEQVDPEILGGLIVRVQDWVYDASVRTRIQAIRSQLIERSSHGIQSGRDRFSN